MALIKCDCCGKEISDKAEKCIHCGNELMLITCPECGNKVKKDLKVCSTCGFPLELPKELIRKEVTESVNTKQTKFDKGIIWASIIGIIIIALVVINLGFAENKYDKAFQQVENGEYYEALNTLKDCTEPNEKNLYRQAYYEICVLSAYNVLRDRLTNPDIKEIYDVEMYSFNIEPGLVVEGGLRQHASKSSPYIIIHYAWVNGYGGTTSQYASFLYDDLMSDSYQYRGNTCDLDINNLKNNPKEYDCISAANEINRVRENAESCGTINIQRINNMLSSGDYRKYKSLHLNLYSNELVE